MAGSARLKIDPYRAGLAATAKGRYADAIALFEQALRQKPDDARVLFALANTAASLGHDDAAENFFHRVLLQEPGRLEAVVNLANLLRKRGRTADAIGLIKPALERDPAQSELWLTLGSALRESGDTGRAEIFYREALRLSPGHPAALGNLADLTADRGALDEAVALYDQALAREPENAQARLNRALLHFLGGNLERAWPDYEYRLKIPERVLVGDHRCPPWSGTLSPGLRLLVTAEQGLGDQIMFASLIPELVGRVAGAGGQVLLEAEERLVPLFSRAFPTVPVHAMTLELRGGRQLTHYDWLKAQGGADAAIAIGSLPRLMRAGLKDFPNPHAYLKPDSSERTKWKGWLRGQASTPTVGICWRSGKFGGLRNVQYAPLSEWTAFLRHFGGQYSCTFVALQYDARDDEIADLQQASGQPILVPPALDQKQEIDRTAALISALDAVVSAPTAVAALSAALGVPTLKPLYGRSWTALGCAHEPFAPSARCIMPDCAGDWSETFARTGAALSRLLSHH